MGILKGRKLGVGWKIFLFSKNVDYGNRWADICLLMQAVGQLAGWGILSLNVYTKISMYSTWLSHWLKCFIKAAPLYWTNRLTKDGKKICSVTMQQNCLSGACLSIHYSGFSRFPSFRFSSQIMPRCLDLLSLSSRITWQLRWQLLHLAPWQVLCLAIVRMTHSLFWVFEEDICLGVKSITVMEYWYF